MQILSAFVRENWPRTQTSTTSHVLQCVEVDRLSQRPSSFRPNCKLFKLKLLSQVLYSLRCYAFKVEQQIREIGPLRPGVTIIHIVMPISKLLVLILSKDRTLFATLKWFEVSSLKIATASIRTTFSG